MNPNDRRQGACRRCLVAIILITGESARLLRRPRPANQQLRTVSTSAPTAEVETGDVLISAEAKSSPGLVAFARSLEAADYGSRWKYTRRVRRGGERQLLTNKGHLAF